MNYESPVVRADDVALAEGAPRRSRRRIILAALAAVVVAIGIALFFMRGGDEGAAAPTGGMGGGDRQVPTVTVSVPGRSTVTRVIAATGTLAARREMPVGVVGEGGNVVRVLVEAGSWANKGQVLAVIDRAVQIQQANQLAAQIRAAAADARLARAELDRAQQLVGRGFISRADIDRKTATLDAANARVAVAQAQLAETRARNGRLDIRAPEAGLVLTRAVEPGQVVTAGSGVLFRMARGGEMELRAQLSEADLTGMSVGVPATVTPVGGARSFKGQVWQVSPIIDPQTRQGIARIALSYDPALRPGGFASAQIMSGASQAPLLPESAVQSDPKGNFVYLVNDRNEAVRRDVRVGATSDAGVAIVEGLTGTERVVMSAGAFLNPGQKVKPVLRASTPAAVTKGS